MKKIRKLIFWTHLVLGVAGGSVILVMCLTGAALSFEKNILAAVEADQRTVASPGERLAVSEMLRRLKGARPQADPTSFTLSRDVNASASVSLGREGQIFIDPYTGEITGEGNRTARAFFALTNDLHRYLAIGGEGRAAGKAVTGACNLMFLGLALTGIYIWMPRRLSWKRLRPQMWFRRTGSGKARDFNWHNTIGFWSSLVLITLTLTGSVLSYQWAGSLIYTLTGDPPPVPQNRPQTNASPTNRGMPASPSAETGGTSPAQVEYGSGVDELWLAAESSVPSWRSISLRLPVGREAQFNIDAGESINPMARSSLTLDTATGAKARWEPYAEQSTARQIRTWIRFTHTGESLGIIGQAIGFLACLGGAGLVYTGLALTARRISAYLRRQRTGDKTVPSL